MRTLRLLILTVALLLVTWSAHALQASPAFNFGVGWMHTAIVAPDVLRAGDEAPVTHSPYIGIDIDFPFKERFSASIGFEYVQSIFDRAPAAVDGGGVVRQTLWRVDSVFIRGKMAAKRSHGDGAIILAAGPYVGIPFNDSSSGIKNPSVTFGVAGHFGVAPLATERVFVEFSYLWDATPMYDLRGVKIDRSELRFGIRVLA